MARKPSGNKLPGSGSGGHPHVSIEKGALQRFGAFVIRRQLWRGPHSCVYLAQDTRDDAFVALKILTAGSHSQAERVSAKREAKCLHALSHPHIVSLRKHGQIEGLEYLSLPYIAGIGLDQALKDGTTSDRPLLEAMVKVCHAMHYAHSHGYLHRDLKPKNIILRNTGDPCILDWGTCWHMGEKTEKGIQNIVGTPSYMSPEQARGEEESLTPATDVYSLGATIYHVLTRRPLFVADTSWRMMQMAMNMPPKPPSEIRKTEKYIEQVVLWAIEKEPQKRYASAQLLAEDLQRAMNGEKPKGPASGFFDRFFG